MVQSLLYGGSGSIFRMHLLSLYEVEKAVQFDILTALPIFPTAKIANQMELMVGPPCRVDRTENNFSSRIFWCETIQHFSIK